MRVPKARRSGVSSTPSDARPKCSRLASQAYAECRLVATPEEGGLEMENASFGPQTAAAQKSGQGALPAAVTSMSAKSAALRGTGPMAALPGPVGGPVLPPKKARMQTYRGGRAMDNEGERGSSHVALPVIGTGSTEGRSASLAATSVSETSMTTESESWEGEQHGGSRR